MKKINNNLFTLRFQKNQVILSALSILLGALIYILLRPTPPAFFQTFSFFGLSDWLDSLRGHTLTASRIFPDWFVYSLPNGLWAFSFTLIIFTIWGKTDSAIKYLWYATIPVLIFGFEYLQYLGVIKGTFSIQDLISGLAGIIAGVLIGILKPKL